eukprot:GFUD01034233.1.p1 GENE.GFUD01034233.1~~GFUD01034233.1.p1  ORF type:complete len:166 (-),score=47.41 GFUD01034233.1:469-966(-)
MGSCLSLWHTPDLTGSTFTHYSLNSQSSSLDLYPGFRYVETEASMSEDDQTMWRRSSAPLLNSWETIPSPQDTLSVSSYVSHSNRSGSDGDCRQELGNHKEAPVNPPSTHNFRWDKGIVKLRKSLKIKSNETANSVGVGGDLSNTNDDMSGSVRDSGETIVEDLL